MGVEGSGVEWLKVERMGVEGPGIAPVDVGWPNRASCRSRGIGRVY
jgi:hypothetical protein